MSCWNNEEKINKCHKMWIFISKKTNRTRCIPYALILCGCCGLGNVEIKCPYILKNWNLSFELFVQKKTSCLSTDGSKTFILLSGALQMYDTKRWYCDFIIWSKDNMFFSENISKTPTFHEYVIIKIFHKSRWCS